MKNVKKIAALVIAFCSLQCYGMEKENPLFFLELLDYDLPEHTQLIEQFSLLSVKEQPPIVYKTDAIPSDQKVISSGNELDEKISNNFLVDNFEHTLGVILRLKQELSALEQKVEWLEKENLLLIIENYRLKKRRDNRLRNIRSHEKSRLHRTASGSDLFRKY